MGIFRHNRGKKAFVIALVLVISLSAVFAENLTISSPLGDARIYDNESRAVKNPTVLSEGWILRTFSSGLVLENEDFSVEIEAGSLAKITSLGKNPVIYILDGNATAKTSDSKLVINTTVTSYVMDRNTSMEVTTTLTEEDCSISEGKAVRIDGITGKKTELQARSTAEEVKTEPEPEVIRTESEPVAEAVVEAVAEPAAEPVVETVIETVEEPVAEVVAEPVEQPVAVSPLQKTFTYGNYSATVTAYIGEGFIEYPSFVTSEEIAAAAKAAYVAYPQYMDGIYFKVLEPGKVQLTYPETYGKAEFDLAMNLIEEALPGYIASLFAKPEEAPVEETVTEPVVEAVTEPVSETVIEKVEEPVAEVAAEPVEQPVAVSPLQKTFTYGNYSATVTACIGEGFIEYPSFVTSEEIAAAAKAAYVAYPQYMDGIYFKVLEPGKVQLTYPETYGKAEFDLAMNLIEEALPGYIASLFAKPEEAPVEETVTEPVVEAVTEPVSETVIEKVEEPVAEVAAEPVVETVIEKVEEPVAEVTVEAVVETVIEKVEEPVAEVTVEAVAEPAVEAAEEKERSWGFSASLIYGNECDSAAVKKLPYRTLIYANSLDVNIQPYFRAGLWKFALRLNFNTSDIKGTIKPESTDGITGIVSTVAKYIGEISYSGDTFRLSVGGDENLNVSSAAFASMDRSFDSFDRLTAVAGITAGKHSVTAFADDMRLNSKRNGGSQYAGLAYTFATDNMKLSANIIADGGKGLRSIILYPSVDAEFSISTEKIDFDVYISAMAKKYLTGDDIAYGTSTVFSLTKGAFTIGAGAAFNRNGHIYGSISNGPVTITEHFNGDSLDVILDAAIRSGHFAVSGHMNAPFTLNGGSRLSYQTVTTRSGDTENITADVMTFKADIMAGRFTFSAGVIFNGFSGRLANAAKALIRRSGRLNALKGMLDPEVATYYGEINLELGDFDIFAKADFVNVEGRRISISVGGKYTF